MKWQTFRSKLDIRHPHNVGPPELCFLVYNCHRPSTKVANLSYRIRGPHLANSQFIHNFNEQSLDNDDVDAKIFSRRQWARLAIRVVPGRRNFVTSNHGGKSRGNDDEPVEYDEWNGLNMIMVVNNG